MNNRSGSRRIFVALMVIALGLVLLLLSPFAQAFIFATVLSSTLYPLHARLSRKLGGHQEWSAALLTVAVVLTLLLPLGGIGAFVVNEAISGVRFVTETLRSEGMTGLLDRLSPTPSRGWRGGPSPRCRSISSASRTRCARAPAPTAAASPRC